MHYWISAAIAPALFWLWFIRRKDHLNPEPRRWVWGAFGFGALSVIPTVLVAFLLISIFDFDRPWQLVLVAPIVEESMKFLAVRLSVVRTRHFDEPVDGMIYAAAAALGFAMVENLLYVLGPLMGEEAADLASRKAALIAGYRAIFSVPGHALHSMFWGRALGESLFPNSAGRRLSIGLGLLLAMISHSAFNAICLSPHVFAGHIALILALWIWHWRSFRKLHARFASKENC